MTFPNDINEAFTKAIAGLACTKFDHPSDWYWQIVFGDSEVSFGIESPWRLLINGSIAFGDEDHAQKFGLPGPVDGPSYCIGLLANSKVVAAQMKIRTGDLLISFDNGASLEVFNRSSGYEGWSCTFGKLNVVAMGGGELAIFGSV